jgi:hypothetical protein
MPENGQSQADRTPCRGIQRHFTGFKPLALANTQAARSLIDGDIVDAKCAQQNPQTETKSKKSLLKARDPRRRKRLQILLDSPARRD